MSKQVVKEITIDNVVYVPKSLVSKMSPPIKGLKLVMIRTYSAGVHFGYLKSHKDKQVELVNARRVWYWSGACSLSQLAMEGSKKPTECKISMEVPSIILTEAIEIIPIAEAGKTNLNSIAVWKQ